MIKKNSKISTFFNRIIYMGIVSSYSSGECHCCCSLSSYSSSSPWSWTY